MTNDWNLEDGDGSVISMKVWDYGESIVRLARFDITDFEVANAHRGTWFAHKAKGQVGKWYVLGKSHGKTVMLHRMIMGVTDHEIEIDHRDNDGLNNRRENLRSCTHKENIRFRQPGRDWERYDQEVWLAEKYRAERELANGLAKEFGLSRQQLWNIRNGKTRNGAAAAEYHRRAVEQGVIRFELLKMKCPKAGKFGVSLSGENRK